MARLARHVSAALVVIAMIAAQVMPAWAGCHARTHAARTMVVASAEAMPAHHGIAHSVMASKALVAAEVAMTAGDPAPSSPADVCLGNCGCACGISCAFVLASTFAVAAPTGVAIGHGLGSVAEVFGRLPDGPRRPPRPLA